MKVKKIALVLLLCFLSSFITGCWNYKELETLAIVTGFAIDRGEGGTGYQLAIEILDTSGDGGSGGDGGSQSAIKSKIIESGGSTIFDAVRNVVGKSDKKLYFGDCKAAIISSQLAREGIAPVLDWMNRDSEPRLTIDVYISKENTAKDIIEQKSPTNPIVSYALAKIDENNPQYLSKSPEMPLYKVNNALGGEGSSLSLPVLDIVKSQKDEAPELGGSAIFKKDKLVGFLGSDESKYLLFIKNQVKGGLLVFSESSPVPDISLEIRKSQTKISVVPGNTPKIKLAIKMDAMLGEMETAADFETEDGLKKLQKDASESLKSNIRQLIAKVQNQYDSDIFGFGSAVYKSDPHYWEGIKPQWDKIFQSLDVEVSVDVELKNTALIQKKVKAGG